MQSKSELHTQLTWGYACGISMLRSRSVSRAKSLHVPCPGVRRACMELHNIINHRLNELRQPCHEKSTSLCPAFRSTSSAFPIDSHLTELSSAAPLRGLLNLAILSKYSVSTKLWMLGWPTAAGLATATSGGAMMQRWKGTWRF